MEPTVSFWDSGEYIATSAKLEVAHPPGAPLFQMIGAFFALFAKDTAHVAQMVNLVSVVSSAFTVLFLFFTITNLVQKLVSNVKHNRKDYSVVVLASGMIGALTFTYSDSFWFNATETEVYAMASFIMAILIWLGIKWIDNLEHRRGNRWLVLISFIIGLTFGIQFMGFLAIPSIVLLFCFKKFKKNNFKYFLLYNLIAVGLLFFVFKLSLTYVLKVFAWGELFFVNEIGLPFNSGSLIMALLFFLCFYLGLRYTRKKSQVITNTVIICLLFLFLGFSSWLMLPIRASVNVGINENDPSDARTLLAYYNREQYGGVESPFYGAYYSDMFSESGDYLDDKPKYERDYELDRYVIVNEYKKATRAPNERHIGILPRLWSQQHAENYMRYFGRLKFQIKSDYISDNDLREAIKKFRQLDSEGKIDTEQYIEFLRSFSEYINVQPPSLVQNLKILFEYQLGYMYLRYFMWNYVGRQNDVQWRYDNNGHWLSGIKSVDSLRLGSQDNLPSEVLENKARNTYFFLPLLLGLVGIIFQARRSPKQFWVLFVFFMFTGFAIQFYTNPYIFQPRERDYSLVGSFYAFAIWIGIGVFGLFNVIQNYIPKKLASTISILTCLFSVPFLMAFQNWDDHDRSNRFTARASAKAYLDSTKKDAGAILFTIGDNDNFPLWYLQEIEGYRTDVRVIVTGYFATDWYIDQMKRKTYKSSPIPSQLTHNDYKYGSRDAIHYQALPNVKENRWAIKDFMNWVGSDKPQTKLKYLFEKMGRDTSVIPKSTLQLVYFPTNKIRIPVNKKNVLQSGLIKEKDSQLIVDYIDIDLPTSYITKNRMMMLDVIANNDWKRPIYFSGGSFDDAEYIWMKDYLQLEGLAYKLVPIKTVNESLFSMGRVDPDLMYDIINNWDWGNSGDYNIYQDPQSRKQFGVTFRLNMARLMEELIRENKNDMAKEIIDMAMLNIPVENYGYYTFIEPFMDGYYKVGELEKARTLFKKLKKVYQERLKYYSQIPTAEQYRHLETIISDMESYRRIINILLENSDTTLIDMEQKLFDSYLNKFNNFIAQ
ncbi:glycosyltransferase family 117 protein [Croceitalea rosinachiae]|uniref:DUF2723 domain-containing protein n=1 Tax=Croceitalea rosinachiae TaxID=3075596 RepID=A0ABU3A9B0_9FLAO|nr:DUF2723 domain-containing protein [Croceitalea sp. F388]MDT0605536.1 DUF2723 domain-containing protein [Croceitalea sp. F388]